MKATVIAMKGLFPNDHAPENPTSSGGGCGKLGPVLKNAGDDHRDDDAEEEKGDTAATPSVGLLNVLRQSGFCSLSFDQG